MSAAVLAGRAFAAGRLVRAARPAEEQESLHYRTWGNHFGIRHHADGSIAEARAAEVIELVRDVVAIGPGLGREPTVIASFDDCRRTHDRPVVLDADGLLRGSPFTEEFKNRSAPLVLTPHPGEFARLTGEATPRTAREREDQALAFSARFKCVVLLKGSGTLVADDSRIYRNSTGNPGMATGGSGDVLTGVVAALIAQGVSAFEAAALGAWVHGRAGDLAACVLGQTALTATDLIDYLPVALRELESDW